MPETAHVRRRVPVLRALLIACLTLGLVGALAGQAAAAAVPEREAGGSRASAALGEGGGSEPASPSSRALAGESAASSNSDSDLRDGARATAARASGGGDDSADRRDNPRSGDDPTGAADGGAAADDAGDAQGSAADRRLGRDRSAGRDRLDGLGDAIRRDTRMRTEGIGGRVRDAVEPRESGARRADASDGGTGATTDEGEITVLADSGDQIELLPGQHHVRVRYRVVVSGVEPPRRAGRTVVLQVLRRGDWVPVAHAKTGAKGRFDIPWYPRTPGRYQVRVRPYSSSSSVRPSDVRRIFVYRKALASWYGPGFYGNRTACGQTFSSRLMGVAHKSLPCGYLVRVRYNGRMKTVPVVDRGPYVHGRDYDLTEALRNYLRFDGVDRILVTA